jgi:hypothetical protein
MTTSLLLRAAPPREHGFHPSPWILRAEYDSRYQVVFSIEQGGTPADPVDAVDAAVLLTDLFREGWVDASRPLATPILRGQTIFRGFELCRASSVVRFGGATWTVRCLIPAALTSDFSWRRLVDFLDRLHTHFATPAT